MLPIIKSNMIEPNILKLTDIFIKGVSQGRSQDLVGKLGTIDIDLPTLGGVL